MKINTNNPIISVVIPTHNRCEFINRSINSALKQTVDNIEVIVVDDKSTDNTEKIINSIHDKRLKYIKLSENKGAPAARNIGIKQSSGEYISLLDSDDEFLPNKFEKQLEMIDKLDDKKSLVYSGYYIMHDKTNEPIKEVIPTEQGNIFNKILEYNCVGSPTPLIHKECFEKCGLYDESLHSCQDWDMWIRISKYYNFWFIPECLAKVYIHGDQISTNIKKKIDGRKVLLEKHKEDISSDKSVHSWHLRRLGFYLCLDEQMDCGRKMILNSIKVDPFNWRGYAHIFLSYIPKKLYKEIVMKLTSTKINDIQLYS